jgi:hypothetical protein
MFWELVQWFVEDVSRFMIEFFFYFFLRGAFFC